VKPVVLQLTPIPDPGEALLEEHFEIVRHLDASQPVTRAAEVRGIATTAHGKATKDLLTQLPALGIISCFSAGTDGIDREAASARGIPVTTTSSLVGAEVADLAMGLVVSLLRQLPQANSYILGGAWHAKGPMPLARSVGGSRLGIVGIGSIGQQLAKRAQAFGMDIAYYTPREKSGLPWRHNASLLALAKESDVLAVCCPATAETRGMIDAKVLENLGPNGYLVNVARGSIVDETALISALRAGTIAGAGLDVFATEPNASRELVDDPRVFATPHIGAATVEVRTAMANEMVRNLLDNIR
jgi:hydroxypyruvate reductase